MLGCFFQSKSLVANQLKRPVSYGLMAFSQSNSLKNSQKKIPHYSIKWPGFMQTRVKTRNREKLF